jgi:uncharacterized membrane protein YccF (DUF307 family)
MPNGVLKSLWFDQGGALTSLGYVMLLVILTLAFGVGAMTIRDQIIQEFGDAAVALENLDQSYSFTVSGVTSEYDDLPTDLEDNADTEPACISVTEPSSGEG